MLRLRQLPAIEVLGDEKWLIGLVNHGTPLLGRDIKVATDPQGLVGAKAHMLVEMVRSDFVVGKRVMLMQVVTLCAEQMSQPGALGRSRLTSRKVELLPNLRNIHVDDIALSFCIAFRAQLPHCR